MERIGLERADGRSISGEVEPTVEAGEEVHQVDAAALREDLQRNYTDHLRMIEKSQLSSFEGVVSSARAGFRISLVLNVMSFVLGAVVIGVGGVMIARAPGELMKIAGISSVLLGSLLVIALLFWKGPLDRILYSVSNLARINLITIGAAHRLNQIARVFVQESITGKMSIASLASLNMLVDDAVRSSIDQLETVVPRGDAEKEVADLVRSGQV